jgi:hypothetical protein
MIYGIGDITKTTSWEIATLLKSPTQDSQTIFNQLKWIEKRENLIKIKF